MSLVSAEEVAKHNRSDDCWVVIHGKVYDLTQFLADHPGGEAVIVKYAGRDATAAFDPIHPKDILNTLPASHYIGDIDPATVRKATPEIIEPETPRSKGALPTLDEMLNVYDFEAVAQKVMKKEAWDYYSSGADDEITLRENHAAFQRLWLRPRVLVNVAQVDTKCSILGYPSSLPIYISPCALGKLGHPEGEVVLTRAAATEGIIQILPTLASCSLEEMTGARAEGQVQFYQLYVNSNRDITEKLVRNAEQRGCKALVITVDAPSLGRREKDMRNKVNSNPASVQKTTAATVKKPHAQGMAKALSPFINPALSWSDIEWFKSITKVPLVLKGIQTGEDALLAVHHGIAAIVVSNHGGRQLDFARPSIEVLQEVMDTLKANQVDNKIEVYVDGGIRRGTDVFKALALGAKAVGIGRPPLYAMSSFGQEGVEKMLQMLRDEFELTMRLMGTTSINDIRPNMVCWRNFVSAPRDHLSDITYQPLPTPALPIPNKL